MRERLRRRHDAELRAGVVDDADFADADAFVDARAVVTAGTSVESDKASYATGSAGFSLAPALRRSFLRALVVATKRVDRASRP